jgi:hypothetical protein
MPERETSQENPNGRNRSGSIDSTDSVVQENQSPAEEVGQGQGEQPRTVTPPVEEDNNANSEQPQRITFPYLTGIAAFTLPASSCCGGAGQAGVPCGANDVFNLNLLQDPINEFFPNQRPLNSLGVSDILDQALLIIDLNDFNDSDEEDEELQNQRYTEDRDPSRGPRQ